MYTHVCLYGCTHTHMFLHETHKWIPWTESPQPAPLLSHPVHTSHSTHHQHIIDTSSTHNQHTINTQATHKQHTSNTQSTHTQSTNHHIHSTHNQHTINTPSTHHRHTITHIQHTRTITDIQVHGQIQNI